MHTVRPPPPPPPQRETDDAHVLVDVERVGLLCKIIRAHRASCFGFRIWLFTGAPVSNPVASTSRTNAHALGFGFRTPAPAPAPSRARTRTCTRTCPGARSQPALVLGRLGAPSSFLLGVPARQLVDIDALSRLAHAHQVEQL